MIDLTIASLIVGVATAMGVCYSIIHGIIRDNRQKRLETTNLLLTFEEKLFEINTNLWQKSEQSLSDGIRTATTYVRILNMICYLHEKDKLDDVTFQYFSRDLKIGKTFRQFIQDCDTREYEKLPYFDKFVDASKNDIDAVSWNLLDPKFVSLRDTFTNK